LLISYLIGGRDAGYARDFMQDIAERNTGGCQLTTDGLRLYIDAVEGAFGVDVDFTQLQKMCGTVAENAKGWYYSPTVCWEAIRLPVSGRLEPDAFRTSHVERQDLTMSIQMLRCTRLTNGFGKKIANHTHKVALYTTFYNFLKVLKSLRETPAIEAGIDTTVRYFEWIVVLIEVRAPTPRKRGEYRR